MKFLYIEPEFPVNFQQFIFKMKDNGIEVVAIGQCDFFELDQEVRNAISWYERANLEDFSDVDRALSIMGDFDYVESHDEHWLRLEAYINTKYNKLGIRQDFIDNWKKKSLMKKVFRSAGLPVAQGQLVHSITELKSLINEFNFPIIVKPDEGVGASKAFKIYNLDQVDLISQYILHEPFLMEEFIDAPVRS